MTGAIPTVEAYATMVNVASDLTSGTIKHDAETIHNFRVSKAFKHTSANVTLCGVDSSSKSVN
jgi:hypothetical protein